MKKMTFLFPFSFLLIASLAFSSCKKGDAGPQGPAGPAGSTGTQGPAGPAGPAGTANVVYSNWLDVDFEADTIHNPDASIDTVSWSATIAAPKLVDSILNRGTVKVYLNISNDPVNNPFITPLPVADISLLGLFITPYFAKQSIILIATDDAGSFTQNNVKYWQYRYVLIPGSVPGRLATINWNNYAEVKAFLGLKD